MTNFDPILLNQIRSNKRLRQTICYLDPLFFGLTYFGHHFTHPLAPFHLEMFHLIRKEYPLVGVMAFRESGKSTILNMANALWSILGQPEKKFVIIVGKTQEQAKTHFANIKHELETNGLLREDFGPFTASTEEWNKQSLELEYQGSKILSVTRDQGLRGIKYGTSRPDLIICDDLEDTREETLAERNALHRWFEHEAMPLGSDGTRIIVLGNLLFENSFLLQFREDLTRRKNGMFRVYPLLDDEGRCLWLEKFPNEETIRSLRTKFSKNTWAHEYILRENYLEVRGTAPELPKDESNDRIICAYYDWKWSALALKYA